MKGKRILSFVLCTVIFLIGLSQTGTASAAFNQGSGYCAGEYDPNAEQPTAVNCTRQSAYNATEFYNSLFWSYQLESHSGTCGISRSPVIGADGTVYFGRNQYNNSLYAVDHYGKLKWTYQTGDGIVSPPCIAADGTIYMGSKDNKLYAINPDGTLKWSYNVGTYGYSAPVIDADGTVYAVNLAGQLLAIYPDGILKWSHDTNDYVLSELAIDSSGVIYFSGMKKIYAIDNDGKEVWSYAVGDGTTFANTPSIAPDGTIYVTASFTGSANDKLYAFDKSGTLKYSKDLPGKANGQMAIASDGTIYILMSNSSESGFLAAFYQNGDPKWQLQTPGGQPPSGAPIIDNGGTVYYTTEQILSNYSYLVAVKSNGSEKWEKEIERCYSSPVIGKDGTIFVGTDQIDPTDPHITYNKLLAINNSFTVSFDTNGGSPVDSFMETPGRTIKAPDKPTFKGHVFKGWYKDAALSQPWNFSTDTITKDTTLYASWGDNNAPSRKAGVSATTTAGVSVNNPYTLDLSTIFEDADSDAMTYKVSVNNGADQTAAASYSYTPTSTGTVTLAFKANDGNTDSTDTYTVTLTVNADNTAPARKDGVAATGTAGVTVNTPYTLDLSTIFEDADSDALTYKVSVNSGDYQTADKNYFYTPITTGTVTLVFKANDGKMDSTDTYTITVTVATSTDKILTSITTPTAISGLTNGTAKTAAALGLPSTVTLVTNNGNVSANVTWNVASSSYDSSSTVAQTFTVNGTVTLPTGVVNTSSVSLTTSICVTVNAVSSSGSGTYSGSGSIPTTGNNSSTTVTTDAGTTTASQTVSATIGSNGVASASVTKTQITDMITAASKKAQAQNTQPALEIKVHSGSTATGVSVTIPQSAASSLTDGVNLLTISSPAVTVTFDDKALAEINKDATGDITVTARKPADTALSDEEKAIIGDRPVYDLKVTSDNAAIFTFGGGTATVSIPYVPTKGEDTSKIVVYYLSGSDELVMVPGCVYDASTGTVTFKTTHFSSYAVGYNNVSFADVSGWYADYVNYLAARGIIDGTGDGKFSPEANITRAQFVTILARLAGNDLSAYTSSAFNDVSTSNWYFAAIQWANKNGIASGYDGAFDPNANITREQMVVMLFNYAKYVGIDVSQVEGMSAREFSDYGSISNWAITPIQWAINKSIVSGNSDGSFAPAANATRAQAAKMIALLMQGMIGW